jgi:hypothetical protein
MVSGFLSPTHIVLLLVVVLMLSAPNGCPKRAARSEAACAPSNTG